MSPAATYLTLVVLLLLGLITLYTYAVSYRHFKTLRHSFDNLASAINVVYTSEKLKE